MFKSSKKRQNNGFSLAEVLIVVAIIGILLAVAIPNVVGYYRSLRLTELDDSARSIFMSAQNRLTALKNEGRDLSKIGEPNTAKMDGTTVDVNYVIKAASGSDAELRAILPGGSIESQLQDNSMVVEFVPDTGAVFAVWYWEKGDFDYEAEAYGAVTADKDSRLSKMVGYYGGSEIERPDIGQMPFPTVSLTNAEELRVQISVPPITGALGGVSGIDNKILIDVLINGSEIVSGANLWRSQTGNTRVGTVVLDTLKTVTPVNFDAAKHTADDGSSGWTYGMQYKEWKSSYSDFDFPDPGEDITVSVRLRYDGEVTIDGKPTNLLPQTVSVTVNSLFDSVEADAATGTRTAHIAYGRHLQNLDAETSGITGTGIVAGAVQDREIDFGQTNPDPIAKPDDNVWYWASTYTGGGTVDKFVSIYNADLVGYDGQNMSIRNLDAVKNPGTFQTNHAVVAGLFGYIKGNSTLATLQNIILINSMINASATDPGVHNVGALAGIAENTEIRNCRVYLENHAPLTPTPMVVGNSRVGGLVGAAYGDVKISDSFASTVLQSSASRYGIGGLVGEEHTNRSTLTVERSYAACCLIGGQNTGGLVGDCESGTSVTISNSYAAGIIANASNTAAGLVAAVPATATLNIESSYSAVRYVTGGITGATVYGAAPGAGTGACYVKQSGVAYAAGSGEEKTASDLKGMIGSATFGTGGGWSAGPNKDSDATPYNQIDETKDLKAPYPYPMLMSGTQVMPHYGDWLESGGYATSFYWENEKDSTGTDHYHFYLVLSDGATKYVADGLCPDHHLLDGLAGQHIGANDWGYGLIGVNAAAVNAAGLTADTSTTKADITTPLGAFLDDSSVTWPDGKPGDDVIAGIKTLLGNDDNVILLKGATTDANNFHAIKTDAGYIEINLAFAAAIDVTHDTTAPAVPTHMGAARAAGSDNFPYQIRTAQQLDNIPDSSESHFEQTHDMVFEAAAAASYSSAPNFKGDFNGGSYRIIDIEKPVFDRLEGNANIHNVILYAPNGGKTINDKGGIAKFSSGTGVAISDTIAAGFIINGETIGGLVGEVDGGTLTISNSEANNDLNGANAGGLVGLVGNNGALEISDSYAGGEITGANTSAGGLVGAVNGSGDVKYSGGVYSYVDMSGTGVTAGTVYGIGPGTVNGTAQYLQSGLGSHTNNDTDAKITGVDLSRLKDGVTTANQAQHTYIPGRSMTEGLTESTTPYPFTPVVTVDAEVYGGAAGTADIPVHYGGWPDEPSAQSLCYYDLVDGNYGVWGYIADPAGGTLTPVNTLASGAPGTGPYATEDGYCVPVEAGGSTPTLSGTSCTVIPTAVATGVTVDSSGKTYDLYRIDTSSIAAATDYYSKITVGTTDYWFNPFFACEVIPKSAAPTAPDDPAAKTFESTGYAVNTVFIRTAGQLAEMAKQTGPERINGKTEQNRNYVQLLDIDFAQYTAGSFTTGKTTTWEPMALDDNGTYDGKEFVISNLYINKTDDDIGLFGNTKGELMNIRLKNVKVTGDGKRVGALAGRFRGNALTNCGVYTDSVNYEDCFVTGTGERVGGLVGSVNSDPETSLTRCFAAVKVTGNGNQVGGLIGFIAATSGDTTLTDCYSGGHTSGGSYDGANANVTGSQQVGGLIGGVENTPGHTVMLTGINYSTCSVNMESSSNTDRIGLLVGYDNSSLVKMDTGAIAFSTGKTFNRGADIEPREEIYLSYRSLIPRKSKASTFKTDYYDTSTGGISSFNKDSFPYATNLSEHHGDWADFELGGVGYWEIADGKLRLKYQSPDTLAAYAKGLISDRFVTLLETDASGFDANDAITDSGYFYVASNGKNGGTHGFAAGAHAATVPSSAGTVHDAISKLFGGDVVDVGVVSLQQSDGDQEWSLMGTDYRVNLCYGSAVECLAIDPMTGEKPDPTLGKGSNPYEIRTVQQLDNIEGTESDLNTSHFKQTHDIDGAGSTGYTANNYFAGTYDGGGHVIRNLHIGKGGLFGFANIPSGNSLVLKNIILYSETSQTINELGMTVGGNPTGAGGLVAAIQNNGDMTVTNCAVAGYIITCTNEQMDAGGLVGTLSMGDGAATRIEKCEAVNTVSTINSGAGGLLGLVISNKSCELQVDSSYAGGSVSGSGNAHVGGIVGWIWASGGTINASFNNDYSYAKLSGVNLSGIAYGNPADVTCTYDNCVCWWDSGWGAALDSGSPGVIQASNLSGLTNCMSGVKAFGTAAETDTHGKNADTDATGPYPYPAVVQEVNEDGSYGNYIHYGDWRE